MTLHQTVTSFVVLILVLLIRFHLPAQPSLMLQKQAIQLRKSLERNHCQPPLVDNQFSSQVFYLLLGFVDPDQVYLTVADRKVLSQYKYGIDEELKGETWRFLPHLSTLLKQKLLHAEKTIDELVQKPLPLNSKENLVLPQHDSIEVAADEAGYIKRWTLYLTYQTIAQLQTTGDVAKEENKARKLAGTIAKRNIRRLLEHPEGYENYLGSLYFNAITACFDPHTTFLTKTEKENFQSSLSSDALSFGIDLFEETDGSVVIERLVPGGPAWKSNVLNKGDELIALKWEGKPKVDLSGTDLEEVLGLMEASNTGKLELTVKGLNGQIKTVALVKEVIREDENIVKSFILSGDKKVGYVSLPGFYTQWENGLGTGCANDLAKEIVKLKAEGIEGLILDVRNNGGGSLMEGISLAGIFVDFGPMSVLQGKDHKPMVMKDMNRGTIYDGPLVLIVNGQSASASELLASTLQDYNRALIIGSPTFGKATGQIIIPIDSTKRVPGFVSVTTFKLFRITGKSAQRTGVKPDIHLPDWYENLNYREASMPFALPSDSISKKIAFTPSKPLPIAELSRRSAARVAASPAFQLVKTFNDYMLAKTKSRSLSISLNVTNYEARIAERNKWRESLDQLSKQHQANFSVQNNQYNQALLQVDPYSKEINNDLIRHMEQDFNLSEVYKVTCDLVQTIKSN